MKERKRDEASRRKKILLRKHIKNESRRGESEKSQKNTIDR